jgi:transformation/transcription domain-associated protein
VQHKAEIFRLKGEFYQKMNDSENANQAFSTAISFFKHLPKGWISWGNLCDQVSFSLELSFIVLHTFGMVQKS